MPAKSKNSYLNLKFAKVTREQAMKRNELCKNLQVLLKKKNFSGVEEMFNNLLDELFQAQKNNIKQSLQPEENDSSFAEEDKENPFLNVSDTIEPSAKKIKIDKEIFSTRLSDTQRRYFKKLRETIISDGYDQIICQEAFDYLAKSFKVKYTPIETRLTTKDCLMLQITCGLSKKRLLEIKSIIEKSIGTKIFPTVDEINNSWIEIKDDFEVKAFTLHSVKINGKIHILDGGNDCNTLNSNEIYGCYNSNIKKDLISRYESLVKSGQIDKNKDTIDICITGNSESNITKICAFFKTQSSTKAHSNILPLAIYKGSDAKNVLRKVTLMFADQINNLNELPGSSKNVKINWFLVADMKFIYNIMGNRTAVSKRPCPYCDKFVGKQLWEDYQDSCDKAIENELYMTDPVFTNIPVERIIPPMLHIFMGLFTDLFKKMKNTLENPTSKTALVKLQKELESINVCIKDYWQTFSGNHIKKILNSSTILFEKFTNEEMDAFNLSEYKEIFNTLSLIQGLCIADELTETQQNELNIYIENLKNLYKYSTVTKEFNVTPNCHILVDHLVEFVGVYGTGSYFSEQGIESLHAWLNNHSSCFQSITYKPTEQCKRMFYLMRVANNCHDSRNW
uniref:AAA_13 domain-containing protein n=1 Tax=Strongyloides papillosus TaxID=174720 RepID=A0A0N5BFS7_STREA